MLTLTPEILRALAEGVNRLNDGDPSDCAAAEAVQTLMLKEHGLILSGWAWWPKQQATYGWVSLDNGRKGYACRHFDGDWWVSWDDGVDGCGTLPLEHGHTLYRDEACTQLLRLTD